MECKEVMDHSRFKLNVLAEWMLLFFTVVGCSNTSGPENGNMQLVWQDEFDGPAGKSPDSSQWNFDIGTDWGNAQLEFDTDRPENASLDGQGHLVITARQESYMGQNHTSARMTSRGLFEPTFGRFEARMRLPTGQGLWPAFWLIGANVNTVGWPAAGEIDIMEYRGQEPSRIHGTVHGPGYSASNGITRKFDADRDRFDTGFHVFAVDWNTDSIKWTVDGKLYHMVTTKDVPGPWVFDHSFYIIMNVAVGGTFVGPPGPNTSFPQTMLVDWVRVYQKKP